MPLSISEVLFSLLLPMLLRVLHILLLNGLAISLSLHTHTILIYQTSAKIRTVNNSSKQETGNQRIGIRDHISINLTLAPPIINRASNSDIIQQRMDDHDFDLWVLEIEAVGLDHGVAFCETAGEG